MRYLGQLVTFLQLETTESRNRIRAAWATFHKYTQELTSKNYLLKHNIDSSCTDDESEDGQSSVSHNDQDSEVSFESDNDEEIDAAEIEEEDWVDYTKRSTNEAMEKMGNEKIRCWNKTPKK